MRKQRPLCSKSSRTLQHLCTLVGLLDKIFKLTLLLKNMHNRESVYLGIISAILFLGSLATLAYAVTLHEKDYIITNFGIKNGNPFITVQGTCRRVL